MNSARVNYSSLAPYYDRLGWANFTLRLWPHIQGFFRMRGSPPDRFLDIACGTGVLARQLADMEVKVTGVDACRDMLKVARERDYPSCFRPRFVLGDMSEFDLGTCFPVTGCFYDALNHLPSDDHLARAFACAYKHTESGGYYLFDVNTELGLKNWGSFCWQRRNKYLVTVDGDWDQKEKSALCSIKAFVRSDAGKVEYVEERILERAFSLDFIEQALAEAGFSKLIIRPFTEGRSIRNSGRILAVCRK